MIDKIKEIFEDMSIPELEKEYNDLFILSNYSNNSFYCNELMYVIRKLIKNLKDR